VRPSRFPPHLSSCVHLSLRASPGQQQKGQVPNLRLRTPDTCEKPAATTLKPRWTLREPFLSGSSLPGHARTAITPDIVRPAHGAAIVEVEKDESGGNCESNGRFFDSYRRAGVGICWAIGLVRNTSLILSLFYVAAGRRAHSRFQPNA
jgi:hypothetical protein